MKRILQHIALAGSLIFGSGCATTGTNQSYSREEQEEALAERGSPNPNYTTQENLEQAARSSMYQNEQLRNRNSINQIQRTMPYIRQHKK